MNLYVWVEFCPDWTDGLAFAIAENLEQAQKLVRQDYGHEPYDWGQLEIHSLDSPIAFSVYGGS